MIEPKHTQRWIVLPFLGDGQGGVSWLNLIGPPRYWLQHFPLHTLPISYHTLPTQVLGLDGDRLAGMGRTRQAAGADRRYGGRRVAIVSVHVMKARGMQRLLNLVDRVESLPWAGVRAISDTCSSGSSVDSASSEILLVHRNLAHQLVGELVVGFLDSRDLTSHPQ